MFNFSVSYVEKRPGRTMQSSNKGRKKERLRGERADQVH